MKIAQPAAEPPSGSESPDWERAEEEGEQAPNHLMQATPNGATDE